MEGSKKIIAGDCLNLMEKHIRVVRQGICVDDVQKCLICDALLICPSVNALKRIKVFECKHAYHEECITQNNVIIF